MATLRLRCRSLNYFLRRYRSNHPAWELGLARHRAERHHPSATVRFSELVTLTSVLRQTTHMRQAPHNVGREPTGKPWLHRLTLARQ